MNAPRIDEAGLRDIDAAMAVMTHAFDPAFGEAWSRGQCLGMMALPDVWLLLARTTTEEPAAGFALTRQTLDEAELLLIAVHPAARGRGLARAMIERTARIACDRGAARLMLEVRESNPALALYRTAGFAQIGRRRNYYRGTAGELHDALTLARVLAPTLP